MHVPMTAAPPGLNRSLLELCDPPKIALPEDSFNMLILQQAPADILHGATGLVHPGRQCAGGGSDSARGAASHASSGSPLHDGVDQHHKSLPATNLPDISERRIG
jgi:hypothetical protein